MTAGLRLATDADRRFVASVWRAVAPTYAALLPGAFEREAFAVERHGLSRRYDTWLLLREDQPVGFAGLSTLSPAYAYLAQLYLLPAFQRRGLGTQLLRLLEERVRPGTEELVLHVHRRADWARAFYTGNGYRLLAASEKEGRRWAHGLLKDWTPPESMLLGRRLAC